MKAVILAGGRGSRLSEETHMRPKPMVEIGGRPMLWHIMRCYASHGITDFVVCTGYLGDVIAEYFSGSHTGVDPAWSVTVADTGADTPTGGRLRRVASLLADEPDFCLTYGDGLGDVDITDSVRFHRGHGRLATVTAVMPPPRFGALRLEGSRVAEFSEKPFGGRINGGFFVLSRAVLDRLEDDDVWEHEPLEDLAAEGELMAYTHDGFWQPVDTLREKEHLEALWASGHAPWQVEP